MGWYICLVVALVQSHIQAYPTTTVAPSGNSTLDINVETKLNIAMTNDQVHRATAKSNTTATVTIFKPDGSNETAVSINTNKVAPENITKAEFNSSNLNLNIKTKVYIEIPTEGDPIASTTTVAEIMTTSLEGEFANATAEITSDRDGNSTAKVNSTVSSNGDRHSEEVETLNVFIRTKFQVQLPKNGENLTAIANTKSKMMFIELDESNSSSVSYSEAEAGDDTTDDSATVTDLGNDRMEINIRSKISVKVPPSGLPTADSKTTTNVLLINQKGRTSLTKTKANVAIDDDDDEAAVNGSEAKVDDLSAKQEPAAISDVSGQGKETPEAKVDDSTAKPNEDTPVKQNDVIAQAEAESVVTPYESVASSKGEAAKPDEPTEISDESAAKPNESAAESNGSTAKTDESAVKLDESASKSDESAVKLEESAVKPDESEVKPNESAVKRDESAAESNGSTAETDESAVKPDESASKPDESAVKPDESTPKPIESRVKLNESVPKPDETAVKTDESAVKPDESAVIPDESVAKPDEPAAKLDDPAAKLDEPAAKPNESAAKPDESAVKSNESLAKTDASTTNAYEPAAKPVESAVKPDESAVKPDESTAKPDESALNADESVTKPDKIDADAIAASVACVCHD